MLTNIQVSRLCRAFLNNFSANIKLSKIQFPKTGQSGGFLTWLLGLLLKTRLPWIGTVLKLLAKSILITLRLTEAASETDATIHKKIFGSGNTTLIISNEEINELMKIVKSLEEPGLLKKGVRKKNKINK